MNLLQRLRRKFLLEPAGYGRPLPPAVLDNEYRSGAWAHFHGLAELPRQSVVAGYVAHLFQNPSVLDLGCGSGRLAQLLTSAKPRRYLGVDLSAEGIKMAQALGLPDCEFQQGDFETWRPREKFDVIIFSECIGYAHDPGALVAAFLPWLAPEGAVVISHFQFGHYLAHWRRVEQHLAPVAWTTVSNPQGQFWDIKLLRRRGKT